LYTTLPKGRTLRLLGFLTFGFGFLDEDLLNLSNIVETVVFGSWNYIVGLSSDRPSLFSIFSISLLLIRMTQARTGTNAKNPTVESKQSKGMVIYG